MAQEDFNDFAKRVEHAESRGRRYGKDGKLLTSPKGAQGEMQVMPTTQTDPGFGVTPAKPGDDADIARVGRDYLAAMEKRYGGNREYAAVAYNWGPGNADKWIAKGADFSKLPPETQAYVQQVTGQGPSATAQASPKEVTPKTTPAADMGTGYQAALALSFLNDQEDDDEKAVAKLEEEQDSEAAKMLAEYKPFNALASLDLTSTAPQHMAFGGLMFRPSTTIKGSSREELDAIKAQYDKYNADAQAYNAALDKYKTEVDKYNTAATEWNAGPRTSKFTMAIPTAPAQFSMGVPTAPTVTQADYDAKAAAAKKDVSNRQAALDAAFDPERYNLSIPKVFADGGDVGMTRLTQGQFEEMLRPEPTMMERASDMIQGGARRALDAMFPIRRVVRTGAEPLAEEWMLNYMKQDPNAVLNNMGYTANHAAAASFHIKNALRKAVGLEPFPDNTLREIPNLEVDSFPTTQAGLPPVKRADGSPMTAEEREPLEQRATDAGYANTRPTTRSAQQLQAYMESMNPTVQVSQRPLERGLLGYVEPDTILKNIGEPNVLHINAQQSPGTAEMTKLHELEHTLDLRGGDIKGRPKVGYSDNNYRAYYLMGNDWRPIEKTVENMVNNKERLENFFRRPIESGYFRPKSLENLKATGDHAGLFKEQIATLSALEQVTGKSLTRDPDMQALFPNTKMMAVYDALTGPRQTRLDARDLPPHTPQPSYTYEFDPVKRFIKKHLTFGNEYGIPVKRADGSPEDGERALTPEEIEAASKPAFLTPKSGLRRQISTKPGQIEGAFAQGVSETPYNLVGAPVDIATMALRPFGYSVQNPVMGSEWIKEKMSAAGVRPQPPTSPTERAFYEAGQLGGGAINPAAPVRGTIAAAQKTGEAAKMLAKDIQQYNQQLAVPGASYAVRPRGGPLLLTDTKPGVSWHTANNEADLPSGVVDPITPIMFDLAGLPDKPLKEWFRSKMGAYMRRDMGSPDDQFVKAAEEGKRLHFLQKPDKNYTEEQLKKDVGYSTPFYRKGEGFNPEGEAQTMYGKMVEGKVDLPLEPVRAGDLLGTQEERLIPPSMLAAAKADPEMRFYGLDNIIVNNLKLEDLRDYMYKMRNTNPQFSAYGQPNVQIPERYRFTDETLKGLTPAQASERVAQAENWFQDTKQKMASAAVNENPQLISHEYKNGSKWASFPDLAEHDDMLKLVQDVGCDGKWCTKGENYALRYGSEDGKRLHVLFDSKARPKAQITLQEQAGTPNDFIGTLEGTEYDNFMNNHPHIAQVIEGEKMSPFAFDNMLADVEQTREYRNWLANQGAKITEIKGVANSTDLENAPFVGEIQDFVKRMDKQHKLQSVENLDGIGMIDLATANDPASIIGSEIYRQLGDYDNYLRKSYLVTNRMQELNGGSTYVVTADTKRLVKQAVEDVMGPMKHATGGMIERRTDNSSRYL